MIKNLVGQPTVYVLECGQGSAIIKLSSGPTAVNNLAERPAFINFDYASHDLDVAILRRFLVTVIAGRKSRRWGY
jgi:hypothetical protein